LTLLASITGTIISNLLLVMGLSMLLGGLRYKEQEFKPIVAGKWFLHDLGSDCNCFATLVISPQMELSKGDR